MADDKNSPNNAVTTAIIVLAVLLGCAFLRANLPPDDKFALKESTTVTQAAFKSALIMFGGFRITCDCVIFKLGEIQTDPPKSYILLPFNGGWVNMDN